MSPEQTAAIERWFPGAHSDVGGGYSGEGSRALPALSYKWMITLLMEDIDFDLSIDSKADVLGDAHWSINDRPGNLGSDCRGGTGLELDAIRNGELQATPTRMGDDVGAATAEAIKTHLEGRAEELPQL